MTTLAATSCALDAMERLCVAAGCAPELPRALHTLHMLLSSQLRQPADPRYHKLQRHNATVRALLALPGSIAVLTALGFYDGGGSYWLWCGADGSGCSCGDGGEGVTEGASPSSTGESSGELRASATSDNSRLPSSGELMQIGACKELVAQRLEHLKAGACEASGSTSLAAA